MKFDISPVIRDHLDTLRNAQTGRASPVDLIAFYALPIAAGCLGYFLGLRFSEASYSVFLAFFGV